VFTATFIFSGYWIITKEFVEDIREETKVEAVKKLTEYMRTLFKAVRRLPDDIWVFG
jgi:phosphoserine phosphatase